MIPVSKIIYAVNILTNRIFETYQNFRNEKLPLSIKYVKLLNDIIYLVHKLLYLLGDLNNTRGTYNQMEMLIDDYEECRKMYYMIKDRIHQIKTEWPINY